MAKVPWRFLDSKWGSGAYHMAVDEALLTLCAQGKSPPTLRVYSFRPFCISLGRFQAARREVDLKLCQRRGFDVVRRPSGGRAVLHEGDIAYSLIASNTAEGLGQTARETYSRLSQVLLEAVRLLGAEAAIINDGPNSSGIGGLCFENPSRYDVMVGGQKVIGSAQVRRQGAVLQHGSMRLNGGHSLDLGVPAAQQNEGNSAGLSDLLDRRVTRRQVSQALNTALASVLSVELTPGSLTDEEASLAQRLMNERYANDAWNLCR
jgi:lipoate-protein ligase A